MHIQQTQWSLEHGWNNQPPGGIDAQLVLVFGSTALLNNHSLLSEIGDAYPNALVAGCSTAGEISQTQVTDNTLVATALCFEHTRVNSAELHVADACNSQALGQHLAQQLVAPDLVHVIVLSDGLLVNGSALVKGMLSALPQHVTITGGLAGDGSRFIRTTVVCNRTSSSGKVVAIGLYGTHLRVGFGSHGGWEPFGRERLVTHSRGNVLYELDGKPALELYRTYLGEHAAGLPATALLFPLDVRDGDNAVGVVRTVLSINMDDQGMVFAGDIPEGACARLMHGSFDRLIAGAAAAASRSKTALGSTEADFALLVSCIGRKLVLQQRVEEELESVRDVLGDDLVLAGFYSYGEISPYERDAVSELHNQTMTVVTFREDTEHA